MGTYQPGNSISGTLSVPIIRLDAAWAADAFVVASLVTAAAPPALMNLVMWTGADDLESQLQAARIFTGIGVLLWGIVADFYPTRRLFLVAGLLQLPATGVLWVFDSLSLQKSADLHSELRTAVSYACHGF